MELVILYKIIFFFFIILLVFAYYGYSIFLNLLAGLFSKAHIRTADYKPKVSIIVPVYNEEKIIKEKIENCLALDYPKHLLQIMICSDCSTDNTIDIVSQHIAKGITICDYRERSGKTGVVNKSVPKAEGEIVVLTDANTMFEPDAVSKLVSMYTSEKIGAVLGQVKLAVPKGVLGLQKEIVYRDFETRLKYIEGLFGATIGAFGGFYSIRKELFVPLPDNAYSNDDLIIPTRILTNNYNVIFDKEAISIEDTGQGVSEEFTRRVRIGAGNFQSFFMLKGMLNPLLGKKFFFYISHKVLRWYSPFLLMVIFFANILIFDEYPFNIVFYFQILFYCLAIIGAIFLKAGITLPIITSVTHFVSMNLAVLLGFFRYVRGIKSSVWESTDRV
jgi:cellulose synthase/poly-beta-1,6-N-acetylglucosamine synthase-like glycosyltransferase